jgi:16S rRNA (adenine1518-N6/adenine1519-N6)-dimethyltransferase
VVKTKKSLGQNFLTDELILNRILETVNPKKQDQFFEIGSGRGALTKRLIPKIKRIDSVEIDKDLISSLRKLESSSTDLTIHQGSVLKINLDKISRNNSKFRVIGNLPYNLSS